MISLKVISSGSLGRSATATYRGHPPVTNHGAEPPWGAGDRRKTPSRRRTARLSWRPAEVLSSKGTGAWSLIAAAISVLLHSWTRQGTDASGKILSPRARTRRVAHARCARRRSPANSRATARSSRSDEAERAELPAFHMTDFENYESDFLGWTEEKHRRVLNELSEIIGGHLSFWSAFLAARFFGAAQSAHP
jgi:hypothetical protein